MILKGRCRADGAKLAIYLLSPKNEQVRVLDIRGTVEDERSPQGLKQSLQDMDELTKMTRAKSSLFHLAINPSDRDRLTPQDWQYSVAKAEKALGLEGQPRAVVSHIYEGKEHLHVVWSRVDVDNRKCVEMSFSNLKLVKAAREIEIELGLQQTPERARGAHKLNQHIQDIQLQQDERTTQPREQRNVIVQNAWDKSQTGQEFKQQIEAAGYQLAEGRRGVLVMDEKNEAHSISRCVQGIKAKDVKAKLSDLGQLPTVEELREPERKRAKEEGKTDKLTRRRAQNTTSEQEDNYSDPTRQNAKNLTTEQLGQLAANDNAAQPEQKKKKRRDYRQYRPR